MRVIGGLHCTDIGGELRVAASPDIICYGSEHLFTALIMWMLLFGFVLGFPLWSLYITHRSATRQSGQEYLDDKRTQKYGYLYRGCKIEYWCVRLCCLQALSLFETFLARLRVEIFESNVVDFACC